VRTLTSDLIGFAPVRRPDLMAPRAEAYYVGLLNAVPHPVFARDRSHRFVFLNNAALSLFDQSKETILGRTVHAVFPKQQADAMAARDSLVFISGCPQTDEESYVDRHGCEHTILVCKSLLQDSAGEPVVVGVITDITQRKRDDSMLRMAAEVFEHSAEGILITDAAGVILSVNKALSTITGFTPDEAIGRNPRFLASGQHDRAFFEDVFHRVRSVGHWTGEVVNRRRSGEIYVAEETICAVRDALGRVQRFIGIIGDITERKNNEERMRYLAQHDVLTGLANRALLQDRIGSALLRAQRDGGKVALLLLDLDQFKAINDAHGHAAGDQLLKQVAVRLTGCVRQTDTVSRIGGDEFVVVLPDLHNSADAERVAHKIAAEIPRPYLLDGQPAEVGISIGIALYPDQGSDQYRLMQAADAAMYQEKQTHRSRLLRPRASAS
jgi:diguanylate cyclase (GGDEF)-like protein/PAS domain S-box-containing protein